MQPELDPTIGYRLEAHATELQDFARQDAFTILTRGRLLSHTESLLRAQTIKRLKRESLELFSVVALWKFEALCKFDDDEPRAPAGTSDGGQWTGGSGGGGSDSNNSDASGDSDVNDDVAAMLQGMEDADQLGDGAEMAAGDGMPGDHQRANKQANDIAKQYGLNDKQQDQLHDDIHGQNYSYHEVVEIAKGILGK